MKLETSLIALSLIFALIGAGLMLNRNYARALEQCERIHTRETCIFILR